MQKFQVSLAFMPEPEVSIRDNPAPTGRRSYVGMLLKNIGVAAAVAPRHQHAWMATVAL
jgi:hypothetical protein